MIWKTIYQEDEKWISYSLVKLNEINDKKSYVDIITKLKLRLSKIESFRESKFENIDDSDLLARWMTWTVTEKKAVRIVKLKKNISEILLEIKKEIAG